ncbi:MAG: hypothetical protein KKF30_11450 [Proteobacteria bacterium]|nr:hypothetical protein [Pseudomonadota bacterium]MBU4471230.1 hypothetical protein [Pseudomonadota bacterium]MCG2753205.1 hypothetical protein [Desulfobacteraceae bacterium]
MESFYLGIDVSKGYSDFVIINEKKQPLVQNFQLDDTFESHNHLYGILKEFLTQRPEATLL